MATTEGLQIHVLILRVTWVAEPCESSAMFLITCRCSSNRKLAQPVDQSGNTRLCCGSRQPSHLRHWMLTSISDGLQALFQSFTRLSPGPRLEGQALPGEERKEDVAKCAPDHKATHYMLWSKQWVPWNEELQFYHVSGRKEKTRYFWTSILISPLTFSNLCCLCKGSSASPWPTSELQMAWLIEREVSVPGLLLRFSSFSPSSNGRQPLLWWVTY